MLRTSFTARSSKNLLLLTDVAKVDEINIAGGSDRKDKTVGRLPSKSSNKATGYLTPDARQTFTQLR